jgi:hypothetical protein
MGPAATSDGSQIFAHEPENDPCHDPVPFGIGIAFVVVAPVIPTLSGLWHWGAMYHVPAWGVNSVPPPLVH